VHAGKPHQCTSSRQMAWALLLSSVEVPYPAVLKAGCLHDRRTYEITLPCDSPLPAATIVPSAIRYHGMSCF
jgi:hypothetical protein